MNLQVSPEDATAVPDDSEWFGRFLRESLDTIAVSTYLAELLPTAFVAADDAAYPELMSRLKGNTAAAHLVQQRFLPLSLSKDLAIRRVVIVDTMDEEAARESVERALAEAEFPPSIIESLEVITFFADLLPAMIARHRPKNLAFEPRPRISDTNLYAIVSTPRAGSTFLGDLLHSIGLGDPIEHMRPWVIELLRNRPRGLFDTVRFAQRLVSFGRSGPIFGTKLISHIAKDLRDTLHAGELSYVMELAGRTKIIYLNRRNKLDQAISSLRAHKTGIWHSTDPKYRAADQYNAFEYNYDEIERTLGYYVAEERQLARWLAECPDLIVVDYDKLRTNPGEACRLIADRLGVVVRNEPTARVEKLADSASDALANRFLSEAKERGVAIKQFLDAEELLQAARRKAAERRAEAERIRTGHARHREGPYQDRHYHLIDYDCAAVPGLPGMFRGPQPKSLAPGGYVLFLGAAQTFGAFAARPFATQVGERLGVDILNLGKGGVSPLFFAENPRYRELIAGARAVVVQAMAARMVPTSRFETVDHMNLMRMRNDPGKSVIDSELAWERVRSEEAPESVAALVAEARTAWIEAMTSIARCARGPAVLLWFSERKPHYNMRLTDLFGLLNYFPQLVDEAMIEAIRLSYTAYVEVVTPRQGGEPTQSMFSDIVLPVIIGGEQKEEQHLKTVNNYYPTQSMHNRVAEVLCPELLKLLRGQVE